MPWSLLLGLAKSYWKPLAVIAILASLVVFHKVSIAYAHHQGVVAGKAEMQVQLDQIQIENSTLRAQIKDANAKIDAAAQKAAETQQAAAKALADEQAKTKVWQGQATQYLAIISRPKATDGQVCSRADSLVRGAIDELR